MARRPGRQEINAEHANKRLANVLAEQEKKNKGANDPLAYVHSGVENRMELWDRRNLGVIPGLEARIRRPRSLGRTRPKPMPVGGATKTHEGGI